MNADVDSDSDGDGEICLPILAGDVAGIVLREQIFCCSQFEQQINLKM